MDVTLVDRLQDVGPLNVDAERPVGQQAGRAVVVVVVVVVQCIGGSVATGRLHHGGVEVDGGQISQSDDADGDTVEIAQQDVTVRLVQCHQTELPGGDPIGVGRDQLTERAGVVVHRLHPVGADTDPAGQSLVAARTVTPVVGT